MSTSELGPEEKVAARKEALRERRKVRVDNSTKRKEEAEALKNEGNELFMKGDYCGAAKIYSEAVEKYGTKPILMSNLATAFMKLELYQETEWAATIALQHDPHMIKARFRRAMARKAMGQLKAASHDLKTVVANDPTCVFAIQELKALQNSGYDEETNRADSAGSRFEYGWPHFDSEAAEYNSDSGTNDSLHVGNGTPCRFYNHNGCVKGDRCAFSHSPDDNSIRDELGKNVCLHYILGHCKFGEAKCIYSHTKDYLPSPAWWENPSRVKEVSALLAIFNMQGQSEDNYDMAARRYPVIQTLARQQGRKIIKDRLKQANELASKVGTKPTSAGPNTTQYILLISLENETYFDSIYAHLLKTLQSRYKLIQALSLDSALKHLSSPDLVAVFVTDVGIIRKRNAPVLKKLVQYVKSGGTVVIGGLFCSHIKGNEFASFFRDTWGVPWKIGSYERTTFSLNPSNELVQRNPSLYPSYSMKAVYVDNISPEMAVYKPMDAFDNFSESPAVIARVGNGYLSYIGDVNAEEASTNTVLAMLGILDAPHQLPGLAPTSQFEVNKSTLQDGSDAPSRRTGTESNNAGQLLSEVNADETASNSAKFVLIIATDDNEMFARIHLHQLAALREKVKLKTATTSSQAQALLTSPNLAGVYLADAGITDPSHSALRTKLVAYTKAGGIVVAAGLLPTMCSESELEGLFGDFGLNWHGGSYERSDFELVSTSELAKKNPSLPKSYSMKALCVAGIDFEELTYLEEPRPESLESPILRIRIGDGIFGYIGDVNAEKETTSVLRAFFNLLDPPRGPPKPTSRKFAIVLSFGMEDAMEKTYPGFFKSLSSKVEVVHKLSDERMVELMSSPDLVGIVVTLPEIADPSHEYIHSKVVEYSKAGGSVVFCALFQPNMHFGEFRLFFLDGWGLNWSLAGGKESSEFKVNSKNDLVKKWSGLPKTFYPGEYGLEGIELEMAVYMPKAKDVDRWNPRTKKFISPIVYASVEKGHIGFIGGSHLSDEHGVIVLAMLGLDV